MKIKMILWKNLENNDSLANSNKKDFYVDIVDDTARVSERKRLPK